MKPTKSRKEQRQERILATLEANPALRVNQLAEALDVSTETIRRDLVELDQLGRLSRTYGGAVSTGNRFEPALNDRLALHVAERQAIARAAVARLDSVEALLLGGGATMLTFARALRETRHRLTVITPAYPVAVELAANPRIEVMMLPGVLEPQEHIACGPEAIRALERFRAEVAVIGASGLAPEGVSEAMLGVGEVYGAMLQSAQHGVVLADHSKFGKRALVLLSDWNAGMSLVTDRAPIGDLYLSMRDRGAEIVLSEASGDI